MSDSPSFDSAQLNLALEQRAAGRDYHEYFIPDSIKRFLFTASKTKLDEMAIGNQYFFKYRFGFKATSTVRPLVIDFQSKYDLLDDEIRWLKRAGHLRVTRQELIVDTSRLMPIYGWLHVVLISLFFATCIIQLSFVGPAISLKRDLIQIALGAMWLTIIAMLVKAFIAPWHTMKSAGAVKSNDISQ